MYIILNIYEGMSCENTTVYVSATLKYLWPFLKTSQNLPFSAISLNHNKMLNTFRMFLIFVLFSEISDATVHKYL